MKLSKRLMVLLVCLTISGGVKTQEFSQEWGTVTTDELELKEYAKDKKAEAIIIYDIGKSKFIYTNNSFEVAFTRRKKIKIFADAGLDQGETEIYYYRNDQIWEKIENLVAYTYNLENGQKTRVALNPEHVYDEKVNDRWWVKKFAMPDVKPGSVIEYKYKLITQASFNLPDWYYQSSIPTLYSEYEVHMVPFYEYVYLLQGASKFDIQSSHVSKGLERRVGPVTFQDYIHKYAMKDVPAFRDEEFITSREDCLVKIDFQKSAFTDIYGARYDIMTTWPKLCNDILKHSDFGRYINSSAKVSKKYFNYSSLEGKTDEEKFHAIVDFVKKNFNWDGYTYYMATKTASKFGVEKTGKSSDINLFLCGMFEEAGLTAKPVILSTRSHGKIRTDYPFEHFFNDVIVVVTFDGRNVLADATDSYCPNYLIPIRCLNDKGLVVEKNSDQWIDLTSAKQSVIKHKTKTRLSENADSLISELEIYATNYKALNLRKKYQKKYSNMEEYLTKKNLEVMDSVMLENYYEKEEPFIISATVSYETESIGNKIYVNPFFEFPVNTNPFRETSRSYDIDMLYPDTYFFATQIEVPVGYKIEELPVDLTMNGKLVEIEYKLSNLSDREIMIMGSYKFNKAVYAAADYGKLKFYYNQIIKKFNEKIVLVKEE